MHYNNKAETEQDLLCKKTTIHLHLQIFARIRPRGRLSNRITFQSHKEVGQPFALVATALNNAVV